MHTAVATHLAGEFTTAGLTLRDGRELLLIGTGPFQEGTITGERFGDDPCDAKCSFNFNDVSQIALTALYPRMMGESRNGELWAIHCS